MSSNTENPWNKVSSKVVYKNQWMVVHEDQVITPGGSESIYARLETPAAAGILAVTEENEAVLVGQYRYPVEQYSWEIIEGAVDSGEDPVSAAKRELREEAGIEASSVFPLGSPFHLANSRSNETAYLFVATGLRFGEATPDETEVLTSKKVPLIDLYEMVDAGEITDAISIIAVQRYRNLFNP